MGGHEQYFKRLKQVLPELPVLGVPNYSKPFTLFVCERDTQALRCSYKNIGLLPSIAYSLIHLLAQSSCLKATSAAARLVEASVDLTLGNGVYLQIPHAVQSLLNSELIQHFPEGRLNSLELLMPSPPTQHIKCCKILNPAMLLPLSDKGEPYNYKVITTHFVTPCSDLPDTL